jgi:hypothetical protein
MKKLILLLSFFLITNNIDAQKIATKKIKEDPFSFDNFILLQNGEKSFIISKFKTTNQEYLCFLQWTYMVYARSHPEAYKEMLPDTITYPGIFDPDKSNMPVKGISKKQAQAFCQWRSDRLNEYLLIREGILLKDFGQSNNESFNTESYLSFQYVGMVKNDLLDKYTRQIRPVIHSDLILLPDFYIASKEEIKICDSLNKLTSFKSLKQIKSDLDWWMTNELEISIYDNDNSPFSSFKSKLAGNTLSTRHKIESFVKKYQKELAGETISFDTAGTIVSDKDYRNFNLYKFKSEIRYYKLVSDSLPDPFVLTSERMEKKNNLGKLDYIYIADNTDGTPICIYRSAFEDSNADDISDAGFYCAMNVPFRIYWKLQEFSLIKYSYRLFRY